jgi:hypothetical protein
MRRGVTISPRLVDIVEVISVLIEARGASPPPRRPSNVAMPTMHIPEAIVDDLERIHSERFADNGDSVPPYVTVYDGIKALDGWKDE